MMQRYKLQNCVVRWGKCVAFATLVTYIAWLHYIKKNHSWLLVANKTARSVTHAVQALCPAFLCLYYCVTTASTREAHGGWRGCCNRHMWGWERAVVCLFCKLITILFVKSTHIGLINDYNVDVFFQAWKILCSIVAFIPEYLMLLGPWNHL